MGGRQKELKEQQLLEPGKVKHDFSGVSVSASSNGHATTSSLRNIREYLRVSDNGSRTMEQGSLCHINVLCFLPSPEPTGERKDGER